mgnify:CR=1 FL=1
MLTDVVVLSYLDVLLEVAGLVDVPEQTKNISLSLQKLFVIYNEIKSRLDWRCTNGTVVLTDLLLLGVGRAQGAQPCKEC